MPARESGISISNAFDGVYDEAQNQREFQDAVMAFRNAGQNEQNSSKTDQKPKYKLKTRNVLSPTPISTQTVLPELDLKFASNMSNSDRLELEKLRNEFVEQNQPPPDILKITDDLPKKYFTDIKTQQKLDEIARERAEIREMFTNVAIEDDVISIDFDEASSSRTVTPVESPVKVVKSEGQAEEKMDGLEAGMSLTQIAGFKLDTDLLELQKHYKSEQNRPRTGIPKSRPTTGRERPVTPGTHWNMSSSVNVVKSVDLSSNLEWKYNNSYWKPEFDKTSEEASFTELSREIIRNTPSELIRDTFSRQETMDSDCIHLSRPCTAASTIVDPVEMQEIENAFMLHDDEY